MYSRSCLMEVRLFSWSVLINFRFFQAPVASYSSTTLLMESASKITWFVLLTSPGKDPVGLCATWNQTASVTTLTETQGNVSWIIPLQETERKRWRQILIIYILELRYKLSVYLLISSQSSYPIRNYCRLRASSPFGDIVKNRPTRGTREKTRKRSLGLRRSLAQIGELGRRLELLMDVCFLFMSQNACENKPCKNKATCQTGFTGKDYRCLCPVGFDGDHCENGKLKLGQLWFTRFHFSYKIRWTVQFSSKIIYKN